MSERHGMYGVGMIIQMAFPAPRKTASIDERTTPCQICAYPLSERHHPLSIKDYGETGEVYHLCAICHELYHLVERFEKGSDRAQLLLIAYIERFGQDERLNSIIQLYEDSKTLEVEMWNAVLHPEA